LFVAIDVPTECKAKLMSLLPVAGRGLRRMTPDRMHLTLHFLGETEPPTLAALETVVASAFRWTEGRPVRLAATGVISGRICRRNSTCTPRRRVDSRGYPESRPFFPSHAGPLPARSAATCDR
jgi:hypothetical protein